MRQQYGLAWTGAALRAHACPTVYIEIRGEIRYLVPPSRGVMTGARSSNPFGHIPVKDTTMVRIEAWSPLAFQYGEGPDDWVACTTWIGNLFFPGRNVLAAVGMATDFEHHLLNRWSLRIGPDSKETVNCAEGAWPDEHHWSVGNAESTSTSWEVPSVTRQASRLATRHSRQH